MVQQPYGVVLRPRVTPRDPKTQAQTAWRNAMKKAGEAFHSLNAQQHAAWVQYAQSLAAPGQRPAPVVQLFIKLGAKAYYINTAAGVPMLPPASPFGGDSISLNVSPQPSAIRFTASAANAQGNVTELLVQKTSSLFAAVFDKHFRSKGFVAFAPGMLSADVPVLPGYYACAIRFARAATGQQTELLRLGTIQAA